MAPRTNILSANPAIPRVLDDRSLQAWVVGIAQTMRFMTVDRTLTTGAVTKVITSIKTEPGTVYGMKIYVVGRRTAGNGALNDGYVSVTRATYRNVAKTLTEIAEQKEYEDTDIVGATVSLAPNGENLEIKVTGVSGYDISWFVWAQTLLGTS